MSEFRLFRQKSNGAVVTYPSHYIDHPVFGSDLEPYDPADDEYEEDKVVVDDHIIPVDQRGTIVASNKKDNE
jgi:hypothetical protein